MKKAGELGFLGISVPEEYGGLGMEFVSAMLVCDYILVPLVHFLLLLELIQVLEYFPLLFMELKIKNKNIFPNLVLASGLDAIV